MRVQVHRQVRVIIPSYKLGVVLVDGKDVLGAIEPIISEGDPVEEFWWFAYPNAINAKPEMFENYEDALRYIKRTPRDWLLDMDNALEHLETGSPHGERIHTREVYPI